VIFIKNREKILHIENTKRGYMGPVGLHAGVNLSHPLALQALSVHCVPQGNLSRFYIKTTTVFFGSNSLFETQHSNFRPVFKQYRYVYFSVST
jgi:hypothetical protein